MDRGKRTRANALLVSAMLALSVFFQGCTASELDEMPMASTDGGKDQTGSKVPLEGGGGGGNGTGYDGKAYVKFGTCNGKADEVKTKIRLKADLSAARYEVRDCVQTEAELDIKELTFPESTTDVVLMGTTSFDHLPANTGFLPPKVSDRFCSYGPVSFRIFHYAGETARYADHSHPEKDVVDSLPLALGSDASCTGQYYTSAGGGTANWDINAPVCNDGPTMNLTIQYLAEPGVEYSWPEMTCFD